MATYFAVPGLCGAGPNRPPGRVRYNPLSPQALASLLVWYGIDATDTYLAVRSKAPRPAPLGVTPVGASIMMRSNRRGLALETTNADGLTYLDFGNSTTLGIPTTAATIVLTYRKTDASARISSAFGVFQTGVDGTTRCGAHLPYVDNTIYFDFGGTTEGTSRLSVAGLTFGDDTWVFTTGARGMEIWQNGVLRASNSGTPTRVATTTSFALFSGQGVSPASDLAQCEDLKVYTTQLSSGLCQHLSHPQTRFDLYATDGRRAYFPVSAAAASTWRGYQSPFGWL